MSQTTYGTLRLPLDAAEACLIIQASGLAVIGFSLNHFFYHVSHLIRVLQHINDYLSLQEELDPDIAIGMQLSGEGRIAGVLLETMFWTGMVVLGLAMARGSRRFISLLVHRSP